MPRQSKTCVWSITLTLTMVLATGLFSGVSAAAPDIVLYPSDITPLQGNWSTVVDSSGAEGRTISSADWGWSKTDAPLSSPSHYFQATITAVANTPYRVMGTPESRSEFKVERLGVGAVQ